MKFCQTHWAALVDAVDARGLADHSHVTIDTSAAGLLARLQATPPADLGRFDGLGDAVTQVLTGLGTVDLAADGCPVCNATSKTDVSKIVQAADQTLATFDDLETAEKQRQAAALFAALGVVSDAARLDYASGAVGRPVAALTDLTGDEAALVIDALTADLRALREGADAGSPEPAKTTNAPKSKGDQQ
ncbi:MAG TPA: hypothetical protein VGF17_19045 [Phytomonospora sp.]